MAQITTALLTHTHTQNDCSYCNNRPIEGSTVLKIYIFQFCNMLFMSKTVYSAVLLYETIYTLPFKNLGSDFLLL